MVGNLNHLVKIKLIYNIPLYIVEMRFKVLYYETKIEDISKMRNILIQNYV